jgi:hypothetical protein
MKGWYVGRPLEEHSLLKRRAKRVCHHCGLEIKLGTPFIRAKGRKYHHGCAVVAGVRRSIA